MNDDSNNCILAASSFMVAMTVRRRSSMRVRRESISTGDTVIVFTATAVVAAADVDVAVTTSSCFTCCSRLGRGTD